MTFEPEGRTVFVLPGTLLIEAAGRAGIVLETPCGGQGVCGKCRVEITRNAPEPCEADRRMLTEAEIERGTRLACQVHVAQELCVYVAGRDALLRAQNPHRRPRPDGGAPSDGHQAAHDAARRRR